MNAKQPSILHGLRLLVLAAAMTHFPCHAEKLIVLWSQQYSVRDRSLRLESVAVATSSVAVAVGDRGSHSEGSDFYALGLNVASGDVLWGSALGRGEARSVSKGPLTVVSGLREVQEGMLADRKAWAAFIDPATGRIRTEVWGSDAFSQFVASVSDRSSYIGGESGSSGYQLVSYSLSGQKVRAADLSVDNPYPGLAMTTLGSGYGVAVSGHASCSGNSRRGEYASGSVFGFSRSLERQWVLAVGEPCYDLFAVDITTDDGSNAIFLGKIANRKGYWGARIAKIGADGKKIWDTDIDENESFEPAGVAVSPSGSILVVGNDRAFLISTSGSILNSVRLPGATLTGVANIPETASFVAVGRNDQHAFAARISVQP